MARQIVLDPFGSSQILRSSRIHFSPLAMNHHEVFSINTLDFLRTFPKITSLVNFVKQRLVIRRRRFGLSLTASRCHVDALFLQLMMRLVKLTYILIEYCECKFKSIYFDFSYHCSARYQPMISKIMVHTHHKGKQSRMNMSIFSLRKKLDR